MSEFIYNNFSQNNENDPNKSYDPETTPNKSKRNGIIAVLCAFSLLFTGGIGGFIGYKLATDKGLSGKGDAVGTYLYEAPSITNTSGDIDPELSGGALTVTQTATLASPTVVEITTEYMVQSYYQYITGGAGSGVIIGEYRDKATDKRLGYLIVTNTHVIQTNSGSIVNAEGITVTVNNGTEYKVNEVIGYDTMGDIAVLAINTEDVLPIAVFGDSDTLIIGEDVLAIGNPLGELGGTVTNGIISALDREINVDGNKMNLLQTNAAINPGNSGGGLFNLRGELVGVVNAKSSGSGIEGLGFAIPSNDAKRIISDLIEFGYVKGRPFVGIAVYTDRYSNVRVYSLTKNHNDGVLQQHDIILEANGKVIKSAEDFNDVISKASPGDTVSLKISRNGTVKNISVNVFEKASN